MNSVTAAVRFSPKEKMVIQEYAKVHQQSFSEVIRQAVLEKIEDEYDLELLLKAIEEDDGVRFSHEEIMREFGL